MTTISVRVNGILAQHLGTSRLQVSLPNQATVADLLATLCRQYPSAAETVQKAVPVINGSHVPPSATLLANQEIALLMPVAGG